LSGTGAIESFINFCRKRCCLKSTNLDKDKQHLRLHYYFLLNIQGRFAALLLSVAMLVLVTFDSMLDRSICTITCQRDKGQILNIVIHFVAYIAVEAIILAISLLFYSYRFTKATCGQTTNDLSFVLRPEYHPMNKATITFGQVQRTLKVVWHSFELHLNRYFVLFYACLLLVIAYVTFGILTTLTPNPRWLHSSSSSSSSSGL